MALTTARLAVRLFKELIAQMSTATAWTIDEDTITFAICRLAAPTVIGQIHLRLTNAHARQAEIGWLLHPSHHGHGTEAANAITALAFTELGVHRLFARLDVENTASVRLCERLGMHQEAYLIENDLDGQRWGSEYMYAVLAREFSH